MPNAFSTISHEMALIPNLPVVNQGQVLQMYPADASTNELEASMKRPRTKADAGPDSG